MSTAKNRICSVCELPMEGSYCSKCGQRYTGKRVSQSTVLQDMLDNLYGLDKSLLGNLKLAVQNPQFLVQNFWSGFRNHYMGPGRVLVITALALVLNFIVTKESFLLITIGTEQVGQQFVFLFVFLFLFCLSSYVAYFWPWKKNFAEHVVLNIYTVGLWTILFTPLSILGGLLEDPAAEYFNTTSFILYAALILIWNARVFPNQSRIKQFGRIVLQAALIAMLFWGLTFL